MLLCISELSRPYHEWGGEAFSDALVGVLFTSPSPLGLNEEDVMKVKEFIISCLLGITLGYVAASIWLWLV